MNLEARYDPAQDAPLTDAAAEGPADPAVSAPVDGMGCHAGADEMEKAARLAGKSEILDRYAADYPQGPHDKPQSMCPAFGSLRVGLRMRRVATVLSGSACCVYGLTFVSHFYGARRSVGYVPFNSETLVTGKLFEDIRDAVHELADPDRYDAVVVTNLCVPTASGVPLKLLPAEINGVRIVGIDVPGFGIPTHAEAKDVLAGAMLKYARAEIEAGPVQAPLQGRSDRPTVALLGEMFPADPMMIGAMLSPLGLAAGPVVPCRDTFLPAIRAALAATPVKGTITLSGYEGSELLVARLLIESGAEVPYVGTACARTPWSEADRDWLEARGVKVRFRASLEDDLSAMEAVRPDLAIGTTPVVQKAKEKAIPSLYFTNLISARPLMGPAGAGSLAQVVNAAIAGRDRMEGMQRFFDGVGSGDSAGIWEGSPNLRPEFRAAHQKKLDNRAKAAKAEEMI